MEFKKFTSLENTYRQNIIDKIVYEGLDECLWIVTEKIHGANFSFWYDGNELKVASRTQFVDGTFYGCQAVIDKYSQGIKDGYDSMGLHGKVLVIYGELYGDGIQKEVKYGQKDFKAFDVVVDSQIKPYKEAFYLTKTCGIGFAPVIFTGSFKDALTVSNTFQSLLTPEEHNGDNFAEGVAIFPDKPKYFNNESRVWLKNKSAAFSEKKERTPKTVVDLPEDVNNLLSLFLVYATPQRVSNVISKVGVVTNKDFGKILGLTVQDMLEDYSKDTGQDFKAQVGDFYKKAISTVNKEVGTVVREQFDKI